MSVAGAAFLGIGAMVGAGVIAGLLGYTVAKLGVRFPSAGGIVAYLVRAWTFGWMVAIALLAVALDRIWTRARDRAAAPVPVPTAAQPSSGVN